MTNSNKTRWWQLGTILPWLMAILFVGDIAGRFMPLEWVAFRTFEPALRTTPRMLGEFEPNKTVRIRRAYGDLAALANVRRLRQYHDESFHSDVFGFRNCCDIFNAQYAGIVTGDSFTVGSAVAESDTLPGQLGAMAGARFYNAGYGGVLIPSGVAFLARELNIRSGVVVLEVVERNLRTPPTPMTDFSPDVFTTAKAAQQVAGATSFLPWLTEVSKKLSPRTPSPLQIISQKIVKRFQNGKLQPNPYRNLAIEGTLSNGDDMLFVVTDLDPLGDINTLSSSWVNYFEWYDKQLKKHKLKVKLVVLLVPNKYTVYGPLLKHNPPPATGDRLLSAIEHQLEQKRIPVVNVTPEFRAVAAEWLPQHRYLYWRDDTHWNSAGIAIATYAGWNAIQTLEPSAAPLKGADVQAPYMRGRVNR